MEERLRGRPATAETVEAASEAVGDGDDLSPPTDAHASADYRRRMARVVARRAVNEAMARGGDGRE
jgi:aerobic carbon-monoxide dehydrogenase medium subunit